MIKFMMDTCYTISMFIHMMLVQVLTSMTRLSSKNTEYPIVYGRNVTLFCNTSAVGLQKTTWMKQSDVFLHQGLSFYPDKYTGNEVTDGSTLTILNVTFLDLNTSYTCLSDVYSYEKVLLVNITNFISLPNSTEITWIILKRAIYVQLKLIRIFPVPNCTIMLNDDLLQTSQRESMHMENVFYHGTLNLTSKIETHICEMSLAVVCVFGSSYSEVLATKVVNNCNDVEYCFHIHVGTITGVCALILILLTTGACFVFLKRKGRCKPFGGHKNNSFIYDVRHYLARYCNYHACRMCCWFHKKSAEIYKNSTTDSGKNVPELLINKQYVQQNGEQTQTTELIIKTNPIPTSRMSYVNKENSVVNIHTETTYNCVDMSSNYVGRSLALDTAHQVPLVNTMNNDQITIKFQN